MTQASEIGSRIVGIDVSKDRLDVFMAGDTFNVENSAAGLKVLVRLLKGVRAAGLEASGGYEVPALKALAAGGVAAYRLDPAQVRSFARGVGQRAKTDAIDARMIARCLAEGIDGMEPYEENEVTERLAALHAFRRKLVGQKTAVAGQADRMTSPLLLTLLAEHQAALADWIAPVEAEIAATIASDPALACKAARLKSAPGVGPVLATALIAGLPELGRIGSRQIAALVGVAPYDRQSGRRARPARCAAGRRNIRNILYMAALAAIRARKRPFAQFYERLTAAGKPPKLAIIAVMRKMVVTLNTMLRTGAAWAT